MGGVGAWPSCCFVSVPLIPQFASNRQIPPQPEPHTAEAYAERDWTALAAEGKLTRLTNDNLKVGARAWRQGGLAFGVWPHHMTSAGAASLNHMCSPQPSDHAPPLQVYLRYHGLTLGGKKEDLLARITAHINQQAV